MTLACAAGTGLPALRTALYEGRSGLRANDFPGCDLETWIGRVAGVEDVALGQGLAEYDCRNNRLALLGLESDGFIERVSALKKRIDPSRIACVIGTSTAGISATEGAYQTLGESGHFADAWIKPRVHTPHTSGMFAARVLGLDGPVITVSTACSSSAKVFATAARLIDAGLADAAVVGGVDSLCLSVLYGFHSLELVSEARCQPFDINRRGLNLGEAAGFALIEAEPQDSLGRLLGWGETSDAWHMASPHPDGIGAIAAMRESIDKAGLEPGDVDYINCHGTATPLNDKVESTAIREVFASPPPASSTKGWTGHTLGGAGITEAVFSLMTLTDGIVPRSLHCEEPEPDWAGFILRESRRIEPRVVMSNSFGFGGSNCTLLLGRA